MESSGLREGQVTQVRGFADHKLRKPLKPTDPSNRRITVIIKYRAGADGQSPYVFSGTMPKAPGEPVTEKFNRKISAPGEPAGSATNQNGTR
jgi:chemotaxis protein MotB